MRENLKRVNRTDRTDGTDGTDGTGGTDELVRVMCVKGEGGQN